MIHKYQGFIRQNIAPKGAGGIGIYDGDGKKVGTVALGRLSPVTKKKLYSVGIVSDVHFSETEPAWNPSGKLEAALTYFEQEGCAFVCNSGDMTQTGFYDENDYVDDGTLTFDAAQFARYKQICDAHAIPVYEVCGNHESYARPITDNLTELASYAGAEMYYSVTQGSDVYLFISQPQGSIPMADEALQWCYETLEANRNKRCFVFVHPYISDDSGNPLEAYDNPIFDGWGTKTTAFKNLLSHYKNTILFHGHSHMMWECQELDKTANYTEVNGFRSVHIPSLCRPASIVNGSRTYQDTKSYGYLMDVYADCIVLNGRDFVGGKWVPTGTFKIDTPLRAVEEKCI